MHPTTTRDYETRTLRMPAGAAVLTGVLTIPAGARGLVLFAHGSGSSRLSTRNRRVAASLQDGGFGTLLFDLLTPDEEAVDAVSGHLRFDIGLLAGRLASITTWIASQPQTAELLVGYFGASTGAAAALVAAAHRPRLVHAIVSRGGRPDLAGQFLPNVKAPTLLIVGGDDTQVVAMNRSALEQMTVAAKELVIVPGAGHLFEEPGALDQVAELARAWFGRHLGGRASGLKPPSREAL